MRAFRMLSVSMALVMLVGGVLVCCAWLLIEGSLPIPLASAALALLGATVLIVEFQDPGVTTTSSECTACGNQSIVVTRTKAWIEGSYRPG